MMIKKDWHIYYAFYILFALSCALLTTVAGINIFVLLLLLVAPWFWIDYRFDQVQKRYILQFMYLIAAICLWDIFTNCLAGNGFLKSMIAMEHDLRTFGFILILWPIFAIQKLARFTLRVLLVVFGIVAALNLFAILLGFTNAGEYLWPTINHMYGQMIVGSLFLLLQYSIDRSSFSWKKILLIGVLFAGLIFGSGRRTGYLLLLAGFPVWIFLNRERFSLKRYRWWIILSLFGVIAFSTQSSVLQDRMTLAYQEFYDFSQLTTAERANINTSVGIRLQFYISTWELIKDHWLVGVGSIQFPELFQKVNLQMGTKMPELFHNPHNEYLFMLATKGVIGLLLYVGIFIQACRLAMIKTDQIQRVGLLMFVYLFMVSIFMNSMMIDMEEGHFTMLILLIFLAPVSLGLEQNKSQKKVVV